VPLSGPLRQRTERQERAVRRPAFEYSRSVTERLCPHPPSLPLCRTRPSRPRAIPIGLIDQHPASWRPPANYLDHETLNAEAAVMVFAHEPKSLGCTVAVEQPALDRRLRYPQCWRLCTYSSTQRRELRHWPSSPLMARRRPRSAAMRSARAVTSLECREASGTSRAGPATAGTTNR
jgi:hypothetical protein